MKIGIAISFFWVLASGSTALDTISENQTIEDGESIVSQNGTFELGFFSPGTSKNRYLGIWYHKITPCTVVWVANRDNPLSGTSGAFMFNKEKMRLFQNGTLIWSFDFDATPMMTDVTTAEARLLDSGNFVIKASSKEDDFIWQSFEHPGDTFLPGMKFGKNLITGREKFLTSWRSRDDPSTGEYVVRWITDDGYPQVYMMKGSAIESRGGPWNGYSYAGLPIYTLTNISSYKLEVIRTQEEAYFMYTLISSRVLERAKLFADGRFEYLHHDRFDQTQVWMQDYSVPLDNCDHYDMCGPYGICNTLTSPYCGCLKGFKPAEERRPDHKWGVSGCQRMVPLADCDHSGSDGFLKFSGVKLPDTQGAWFNEGMTLEECEVACKKNCSCTAYANPYIAVAVSTGCLRWFGDLIDIRLYAQTGQDLYVRMDASELSRLQSRYNKKKQILLKVMLPTSAGLAVLSMIFALCLWSRWKKSNADLEGSLLMLLDNRHDGSIETRDIHLRLFRLSKIAMATNNFSIENKLGEGGFGPVYKAVLEGQEVAVKRLSTSSSQGLQEFKNEIICIAKLQHRNLVKLLGYCIQGVEIILIYEYLPNKSLDRFIFDDSKKPLLDWPQRFDIIHGIARGLLYMHQDSRLRVVHRDLKADNILLDVDMTPKISDFGLARMFGPHETEANTRKVVGTLGYISPEYVRSGIFSVKSDIFSFGVLMLEIVSGKKNRVFSYQGREDNLLGHAWRLYQEGRSLDLADEFLGESWSISEITRCVMIGLLCVQQRPQDRPSMSSVLFMLGGEGSIPPPKQPAFFYVENESTSNISSDKITMTEIYGR